MSGLGTMIWKNGQKFVGQWLNGLKHGQGLETYPENDEYGRVSYKGHWEKHLMFGYGTMIWANGQNYTGLWMNSMPDGFGLLYFPDNDDSNRLSYEGEWNL